MAQDSAKRQTLRPRAKLLPRQSPCDTGAARLRREPRLTETQEPTAPGGGAVAPRPPAAFLGGTAVKSSQENPRFSAAPKQVLF